MTWTAARAAPLALAALLLALAPLAQAQAHDHAASTGVAIAHDAPPSGRTYTGNLNHFAVLDLGTTDLVPDFHQQNHVRVTWNGLVLYETTADSGHDYDGIHAFDIAFPGPGPYVVEALDDAGHPLAAFNGTVVDPKPGSGAAPRFDAFAAEVPAFAAGDYAFGTYDANATLVPHADALVEVLRDGHLQFRTKTHTHEERQAFRYGYLQPGAYTVRVVDFLSYPSGKERLDFAPQALEGAVMVGAPAGAPMPEPGVSVNDGAAALPPTDQNAVTLGATQGGDLQLVGTYDPYTVVGAGALQHLTALVMDPATGQSVQHVDFTARLTGPQGLVFESDTLHEYDGLYELATAQDVPGVYRLAVTAEMGDWSGRMDMAYTVVPPAAPVGLDVPPQPASGAAIYTVDGLDDATAGRPLDLTIHARGLAGQPVPHSEVDVALLDADGVPVLLTKLHTHSDGDFPFTATLPAAGDYTLRLTPFALDPQAQLVAYGGQVGGSLDLPVHADAGEPLPAAATQDGAGAQQAPAAPAAAGLALLALAAALRRR